MTFSNLTQVDQVQVYVRTDADGKNSISHKTRSMLCQIITDVIQPQSDVAQ